MPSKTWQQICAEVQKYRDDSIARVESVPQAPKELPLDVTGVPRQLLSPEDVSVTELPPEHLQAKLQSGELKCVPVIQAFLRRAALAQQLTNCISELLPESALKRAEELDAYFERNKAPIGPLHGVPISVKEHIGMKGLTLNAATVSWSDNAAAEDADILNTLRARGAIFHARTTQPQTLMHLETSSNLWGVTVNPFNRNLTAGGSSGGEGALLGLLGSCLGVGTDIGGSIRSPAANNCLYGLRPSALRLSMKGILDAGEGSESILGTVGPLSTTLSGVKVFMKSIIDTKPWLSDPSLVSLPWREQSQLLNLQRTGKLKVAVMWDDGVVTPHPPIRRVLREVVEKLKKAPEIDVVDWKPYKHDWAWELISALYFPDGGDAEAQAIDESGEPWCPLSKWILKENPHVKRLALEDLWEKTSFREHYRLKYAELWNETATGTDSITGEPIGMVDVILSPVGPGAAPPLDCARYWGYTSQWNLLDYPSLAFPVGKVDPSADVKDASYTPKNAQDEYNHQLYDPKVYVNAPLSLQLTARRFEDEKLLQAFEFIQRYT